MSIYQTSEVPPFSLTIIEGGEQGERFIFEQREVTLGRIVDNDLVLYDSAVSRRHAVIYYRNGQFILEDLGSSNGTILNGNFITQPTVLYEGDLIDIGSVRFQFSTTAVYDDDSPTEVEWEDSSVQTPLPQNSPPPNPSVLPRAEVNDAYLPPAGDTQAFSPNRLPPAPQSNPMARPQGAGGLVSTQEPRFPQFPNGQISPRQSSSGISPPNLPPTAPPAGTPPPQVPLSRQSIPLPKKIPQMPTAPPGQPRPRESASSASPPLSDHSLQQAQKRQLQKKARRELHLRMIKLTIASFVLLLFSAAIFIIPSSLPLKKKVPYKAIELSPDSETLFSKYFGYNDKTKKYPLLVPFKFFYTDGQPYISFYIISSKAVEIYVNNNKFVTIEPVAKLWLPQRWSIPAVFLRKGKYNTLIFVHKSKNKDLWGLTRIKLSIKEEPPDIAKAKIACSKAESDFLRLELVRREKALAKLYKSSLKNYQKCLLYLSSHPKLNKNENLKKLYTQALRGLIKLNKLLNKLYTQYLYKYKTFSSKRRKIRLLKKLAMFYLPEDPRYKRIQTHLKALSIR